MCEPWPGPRCSYDMSRKRSVRANRVIKEVEKYGPESPQALLAAARLENADAEYNATPEGIAKLQKQLEENPNDLSVQRKLNLALDTRTMQVNAAGEIKNGRVEKLTQVVNQLTSFYDEDEVRSVLESSREETEKYAMYGNTRPSFHSNESAYKEYLDTIENSLNNRYPEGIPAEAKANLEALRAIPAPDAINMKSYDKIPNALDKGRKQLIAQIHNAAALQGVEPKVAAEYYEAYRKQYKEKFANLAEKDKPDPPEHWIRGEFGQSGYAKDPTSSFAPHDPSSVYAIYRLRSDENAIPDYVKNSQSIASIDLETSGPTGKEGFKPENGRIIEVGIVSYNPEGKKTNTYSQLIRPESSFLEQHGTGAEDVHKIAVKDLDNKPSWNQVTPEISNQLKGKILLAQNARFEREWLASKLPDFDNRIQFIDTMEVSRKHFDFPDHKLKTICENNGVVYSNGHRAEHDAAVTGEVFFRQKKAIKKAWNAKAARSNAPTITDVNSSSRWNKKSK